MSRKRRFLAFAGVAAAALVAVIAALAAGELDPTFGDNGKVRTDHAPDGSGDLIRDIDLQTNGRILAGGKVHDQTLGEDDWALARYLPDGTLDASFGGGDGLVITDHGGAFDEIEGVDVQANGRILAAGPTPGTPGMFTLARYLPSGALDPSFDGDGIVTTPFVEGPSAAHDVMVLSNGRILVVGSAGDRWALARYLPNGSLDPSFDGDGKVTTAWDAVAFAEALEVTQQSNGRLVAVGYVFDSFQFDVAVARYLTNGALDTSFDGDGKRVVLLTGDQDATDVSMQSTKILVVGTTNELATADFHVLRLNPNGSLDPTFDGDGRVTIDFDTTTDQASSLVQLNGKIIVGGRAEPGVRQMALARLTTTGALDATFGTGGLMRVNIPSGPEAINDITTWGSFILTGGWAGEEPDRDFALTRHVG